MEGGRRNITQETRSYILGHPSIRECAARGLLNHSALAREICDRLQIQQFDAVLAAAKRFAQSTKPRIVEEKIVSLIKSAQVRVTNQIAVAVMDAPREIEPLLLLQKRVREARGRFNLIESDEVITIILSEQHLASVRVQFRSLLRQVTTGLAQVNYLFDERIEITPGVVSFIYGLLAFHGVNVREEMSCWTDLILIVDERDVSKVLDIIRLLQ